MAAFQRSAGGGGHWGFALQSCELNRRAGLPRRNQNATTRAGAARRLRNQMILPDRRARQPGPAQRVASVQLKRTRTEPRVGIVPRRRSTHGRVCERCAGLVRETLDFFVWMWPWKRSRKFSLTAIWERTAAYTRPQPAASTPRSPLRPGTRSLGASKALILQRLVSCI
jgi:hypothetical protein